MLTAVLLEDELWAKATEPRRQEWRLSIRELLDEHTFSIDASPLLARIFVREDGIDIRWEVPGQGTIAETPIARATLERELVPYVEICRGITAPGAQPANVAELDQAKKDAHDAGGRLIESLCAAVSPTHATARRIYTLLVTLLVDTSTLGALRRPHQSA